MLHNLAASPLLKIQPSLPLTPIHDSPRQLPPNPSFSKTSGPEARTWFQHPENWGKPLPLWALGKRGTAAPTSPGRCKDK